MGVSTHLDSEKVQRYADFRFSMVQFYYESIPAFYDGYLQDIYAWVEAGNAFVDSKKIMMC